MVTSEEGIGRLGTAAKALIGDRDVLKDVRMKGRGGKGTDQVAEEEVEELLNQNLEMAVIWDAQGMNDVPVLVGEDTFNDLIDSGAPVIGRGHGSEGNASDYLDDDLRFLPGTGGEASGKGEYWSDPTGGWSSWQSGDGNTVAVLSPNVRRMGSEELNAEAAANRQISKAFELVNAGYAGDEITKTDPADVIAKMDAEIAKISDLADSAPIWETQIGQLWKQLKDSVRENGDPDSLNAMLLLNKINNTYDGKNLIAPILGYDTIKLNNGVELVMNRSALITLDRTLSGGDLSTFYKRARDVYAERRG